MSVGSEWGPWQWGSVIATHVAVTEPQLIFSILIASFDTFIITIDGLGTGRAYCFSLRLCQKSNNYPLDRRTSRHTSRHQPGVHATNLHTNAPCCHLRQQTYVLTPSAVIPFNFQEPKVFAAKPPPGQQQSRDWKSAGRWKPKAKKPKVRKEWKAESQQMHSFTLFSFHGLYSLLFKGKSENVRNVMWDFINVFNTL